MEKILGEGETPLTVLRAGIIVGAGSASFELIRDLTEKLPDAFLGFTLPFYHGAPNASDYFPKESFIPIDIGDYERSRDIIRFHLANNEYDDRLPYIIEARRRVLEEENLFAILARTIREKDPLITTHTMGRVIRNRSTMRIKNPIAGIRSLAQKATTGAYHRFTSKSRARPKGPWNQPPWARPEVTIVIGFQDAV